MRHLEKKEFWKGKKEKTIKAGRTQEEDRERRKSKIERYRQKEK